MIGSAHDDNLLSDNLSESEALGEAGSGAIRKLNRVEKKLGATLPDQLTNHWSKLADEHGTLRSRKGAISRASALAEALRDSVKKTTMPKVWKSFLSKRDRYRVSFGERSQHPPLTTVRGLRQHFPALVQQLSNVIVHLL